MIRGPVLPQMREGLWRLVANHLDVLETGLALVLEDLDCSGGQLGAVDGLGRDASGAPVLLLLAVDGDPLLPARALAAVEFLDRVGDALSTAIPEAGLAVGARGRVLVITSGNGPAVGSLLRHLPAGAIEVCRLEPFRVAGSERFAVRWLAAGANVAPTAAVPGAPVDFVVAEAARSAWSSIARVCERLDVGVRLDGDRYRRRITWHGRLLGEVTSRDGGLFGSIQEGAVRPLATAADVREFNDQLVRRFASFSGMAGGGAEPVPGGRSREEGAVGGGTGRGATKGTLSESLRATLASARLSPEEYSALGGPARLAGGGAEVAGVADDVARIVAAQEGSWQGPTMRTD